MSRLSDLLSVSRGVYRGYFAGEDLGGLAAPPVIKADYDVPSLLVKGESRPSERLEGCRELQAKITLKLKNVNLAWRLLENIHSEADKLELVNSGNRSNTRLTFPESWLLPVWEFEPSFTGDHLITLHFFSRNDGDGKLFYFTGT